jgi:hypothetical protein
MNYLISPLVRRFIVLRESIAYREQRFEKLEPRPLWGAILALQVDKTELAKLIRLPQVLSFLEQEREERSIVFDRPKLDWV